MAGISYADVNAPAGMGATTQSIFRSAFVEIGSAAGGFVGGPILQYTGVQKMFLTFGTLIFLVASIYGVLQRRRLAS